MQPSSLSRGSLFVDFENVYYFFKQRLENPSESNDRCIDLLRALRERLTKDLRIQPIVMHAYADFERIEENSQSPLYLMGIEPHFVMGTDHKNAADMRLSIDALEVFYTRSEISTFVFVAGDRDYIPLIQHLQKHGRRVLVVAFSENVSGDLLQIVSRDNFLEAKELLPATVRMKEVQDSRTSVGLRAQTELMPAPATNSPVKFEKWMKLEDENERTALEIMLKYFGDKREVWVTPYLHKLRFEMPLLAEFERKALITNLTDCGAIAVERRRGEPKDYSVIFINYDHPDVIDLYPRAK